MILNKRDVIIQKIEQLKQGEFKATGLKIELEAHFDRGRGGRCGDCDDGRRECNECDGNYEDYSTCDECDGSGTRSAYTRMNGEIIPEHECEDCGGSGEVNCTYCDEGWYDCGDCSGDDSEWGDDKKCNTYMMKRLAELGLAEYLPDADSIQLSHHFATKWHPIAPLMYSEFYRDGSVDSENTLTLSLEDPAKVVDLLPKIIQIWNDLGDEIGNGVNLARAGMHMALLNDANCVYPSDNRVGDDQRFKNFSKSMSLLLPALFFLGSGDDKSRELRFRQPRVAYSYGDWSDNKYSAVYYNGGAVEFRVFNTCYDNPEVIFDNLVVMANCMRYWTSKYKPSGLSKITARTTFGNDNGDKLDRFYVTAQHIDLLNAGLAKLKPAYYSIREVKKQRSFGVNKRWLHKKERDDRAVMEKEYVQYEKRFTWDMLIRKNRWTADYLEEFTYNTQVPEVEQMQEIMANVNAKVKEREERQLEGKYTRTKYVEDKLRQLNESCGRYRIGEEV